MVFPLRKNFVASLLKISKLPSAVILGSLRGVLRERHTFTDCPRPTITPEICFPPCYDQLPPLDLKYYKPSDKEKRIYQQQWDECVTVKRKRMECISVPPKRVRRIFRRPKKVSKTACPQNQEKFNFICEKETPKETTPIPPASMRRCPKIKSEKCGKKRSFKPCLKPRKECKKRQTMYPSFSECRKPCPIELPNVECNCLANATLCEAWMEFYRRNNRK